MRVIARSIEMKYELLHISQELLNGFALQRYLLKEDGIPDAKT